MTVRTKSQTVAEIKAEEKSKAAAARQAKLAKKNAPSKEALAKRSAADIARAQAAQPSDDKQKKTMGVVARGNVVYTDSGIKGPGEFVTLPRQEIEKLRARGVLVDEGRAVEPIGKGPSFYHKDRITQHLPEE